MTRATARTLIRATFATWLGLSLSLELSAQVAEPVRKDAAALMDDLMADRGRIGRPFSRTDQRGRRVGSEQWQGSVVLLYFGYLSCPDACPTDLAAIGLAIGTLGPLGDRVKPVFVTLDPQRDTAAQLGPYRQRFHPRFLALRGTEQETRDIAHAYKVYFEKIPVGATQDYAIDHTSFIYVLDTHGRYAGFFPPGTSGARIADRLREMIRENPP